MNKDRKFVRMNTIQGLWKHKLYKFIGITTQNSVNMDVEMLICMIQWSWKLHRRHNFNIHMYINRQNKYKNNLSRINKTSQVEHTDV